MHVPEHIIEEVRTRNDIVDVIGEHVRLQKRGKNFLGLCPFHNEKTPSFNVNPDLGIYKCFGCGKSGNVYRFLMDQQGMSFPEALRFLAQRAGISLPEQEQNADDREAASRADLAHRSLAAAADFYAACMHSPRGKRAQQYSHRRGFSEEIEHAFMMGYSPDEWQATTNELLRQGFTEQTLEDAGLIIRREDGSIYDRFRGRFMFPIQDVMGRVIGFGARLLQDEATQAKYLNSPQSLVYDKSSVLYGLFQAKQYIRQLDKAILTEGYADTVSLHQYGFRNVIASSGTSLTDEQLKLLSRYTRNLVLLYDGDAAGTKAAMRGVELALRAGFELSIVTLPNNEDPDSFVRNHGADALHSYLRDARSFLDFLAEQMQKQGEFDTPKSTADAIRTLVSHVAQVQDALQREFMLRSLAQKYSLREELLYAELQKLDSSFKAVPQRQQQRSSPTQHSAVAANSTASEKSTIAISAEERALLRLILLKPDIFSLMESEYGIAAETFPSDLARRVYTALEHALHEGHEISAVLNEAYGLSEDERSLITDILFRVEQPSSNWENYDITIVEAAPALLIQDALLRLRLAALVREQKDLQMRIKTDPEDVAALQRFQTLNALRLELEAEMRQIENDEEEDD